MPHVILHELLHAALITGLVFVLMMLVEVVTILTRDRITRTLRGGRWREHVIAGVLGATPGCGGAFLAVSMYARGTVSFGALLAATIATAGDESLVMLARAPRAGLALLAVLFVIGVSAGRLVDHLGRRWGLVTDECCEHSRLHDEDLDPDRLIHDVWPPRPRLRPAGPRLFLLTPVAVLFIGLVTTGFGHAEWGFERIVFSSVTGLGVVLLVFAPEHQLREHFWHHLARRHLPPIFAWTAGTLIVVELFVGSADLSTLPGAGAAVVVAAAVLGLIPASGPHLVVFILFLEGQAPAGALIANSIVQDGHGLLPLLGLAPRRVVQLKLLKLAIGVIVGLAFLAFGI